MTRWPALVLGSALTALSCADARAAIDWSYDWSQSSASVSSNNGHSSVLFDRQGTNTGANTSAVIATDLRVKSTTSDDNPDQFTNRPYQLTLKLTDTNGGPGPHEVTLHFAGLLSGYVSAHSAWLTSVFTSPTSYKGIKLGNDLYNVSLGAYTGPGPVGGVPGSIGANVSVKPAPEPCTLVLGSVGLSLLGVVTWRRRRA